MCPCCKYAQKPAHLQYLFEPSMHANKGTVGVRVLIIKNKIKLLDYVLVVFHDHLRGQMDTRLFAIQWRGDDIQTPKSIWTIIAPGEPNFVKEKQFCLQTWKKCIFHWVVHMKKVLFY